jgi:hypothetical protein
MSCSDKYSVEFRNIIRLELFLHHQALPESHQSPFYVIHNVINL